MLLLMLPPLKKKSMVSEVYAGAIKAEMLIREEKNPFLAKSKRKTMRFLDDSIDKKLNNNQ